MLFNFQLFPFSEILSEIRRRGQQEHSLLSWYHFHLQLLLLRGKALDGAVELIPGEERNCHSNSARLWRESKEILALATGYALSEDGLWRQHSWVMRKQLPVVCGLGKASLILRKYPEQWKLKCQLLAELKTRQNLEPTNYR
jgi:hypothetical protein